jgi:hypothetical protein
MRYAGAVIMIALNRYNSVTFSRYSCILMKFRRLYVARGCERRTSLSEEAASSLSLRDDTMHVRKKIILYGGI